MPKIKYIFNHEFPIITNNNIYICVRFVKFLALFARWRVELDNKINDISKFYQPTPTSSDRASKSSAKEKTVSILTIIRIYRHTILTRALFS